MSRPLGNAPEYTYTPSEMNRALMARPALPELAGIDNGGMDYPTIERMTRTYSGYHAGCGVSIAAARQRAGLSQEQIGQAMDVSRSMISKYELNWISIPRRTALLMADALGISVDELLYGVVEQAVAD